MRFDMQTVPLAQVTLQAVEANEGYARRFNVRLELAAIDPSWRVNVDPDRYVQVMSNLLSNAAKYSSAGGRGSRVWSERRGRQRACPRQGPGAREFPEDFRERYLPESSPQADSVPQGRKRPGPDFGLANSAEGIRAATCGGPAGV